MPDTLLILHVKGTQAETAELPKHVVRAAISQGQITHSQLIWSPEANAWKQVRELPDLLPSERVILHVKGTQAETTELPKYAVRDAISQGQITHSQLIWSPEANAWKQVRELPDLLPSQKLAPAPTRKTAVPVRKVVPAIIPESSIAPVAPAAAAPVSTLRVRVAAVPAGTPRVRAAATPALTPHVRAAAPPTAIPRVRVATTAATTPHVHVAAASAKTPRVRVTTTAAKTPTLRAATPVLVRSTGNLEVKEDEDSHPLKWVCIGLGILIPLVFGLNYLLVDRPLVSNLGQTAYSNVTVHAHFGGFIQPNVMVIHIPTSSAITPDNLTDFFVTLARSTPENPLTRDFFERVALTPGWMAQYSFSGGSWKELGDMQRESDAQRKEALLERLDDAGGQPLLPESTLDEAAQQARRDKVWNDFAAHFTAKRQE